MSEKLKESLSAVIDGEADEFELRRVLDEIGRNDQLALCWERYHVSLLCELLGGNDLPAEFLGLLPGIAPRQLADYYVDAAILQAGGVGAALYSRASHDFDRLPLEVGQVSGPIRADRAIFFLEATARMPADSAAFAAETEELRELVLQDAMQMRVQLVIASLRESADFSDVREALRQAQREQFQRPAGNPLGF